MKSTKLESKELTMLVALVVAALAVALLQYFVQHEENSGSAPSADMQTLAPPFEDDGSNRFDQPVEATAEDKRKMDAFAAQITAYVIWFRRYGAPFLVRLYVAIGIIMMLRSMLKKMSTDATKITGR